MLYQSGVVKFCPGIPTAGTVCTCAVAGHNCYYLVMIEGNDFIAPELYGAKEFDCVEMEKTYVYSLGMTVYYALEYQSANHGQVGYLIIAVTV